MGKSGEEESGQPDAMRLRSLRSDSWDAVGKTGEGMALGGRRLKKNG